MQRQDDSSPLGSLIMEKLSLFTDKEKGCAYYMERDGRTSWCGLREALELRRVLLSLFIHFQWRIQGQVFW